MKHDANNKIEEKHKTKTTNMNTKQISTYYSEKSKWKYPTSPYTTQRNKKKLCRE